ncbi:MAG: response regulator transcription factor [Candidatus Thorarchaeota archaeon SMTZ1-45]|nr:MAG: hypothetical protein AM325_08225 [Candidatus Thorarchaeota archaeon SMTZ1-45]
MLPIIDGFKVCKELKEHISFKKTPILILTAKNRISDIQRGKSVDADEYIIKPFSSKNLVAIIRKHFGIL